MNYFWLSSPIIDPTRLVFGFVDPAIFSIACMAVGAGIAYTVGTTLPTMFLYLFQRGKWAEYQQRNASLMPRIARHRTNVVTVNPTNLTGNIDFYGESITSLSSYRAWLRKHSALRRQSEFSL